MVENISFTDYDLDLGDIGGTVAWDTAFDEAKARLKERSLCLSSRGPGLCDLPLRQHHRWQRGGLGELLGPFGCEALTD